MARASRPTIIDVARKAGVSPSLVSRVLRGQSGYASPENVAAVWRAAAELAYQPDPVGRQLRSGRSAFVGVLFYRLAAYRNYAPVLTGIEDVLRPAGYGQVVASTQGLDDELEAIERFRNQRVAGVILISSLVRQRSDHLAPLVREGLPLVAINRWTEADGDALEPAPALPALHRTRAWGWTSARCGGLQASAVVPRATALRGPFRGALGVVASSLRSAGLLRLNGPEDASAGPPVDVVTRGEYVAAGAGAPCSRAPRPFGRPRPRRAFNWAGPA